MLNNILDLSSYCSLRLRLGRGRRLICNLLFIAERPSVHAFLCTLGVARALCRSVGMGVLSDLFVTSSRAENLSKKRTCAMAEVHRRQKKVQVDRLVWCCSPYHFIHSPCPEAESPRSTISVIFLRILWASAINEAIDPIWQHNDCNGD